MAIVLLGLFVAIPVLAQTTGGQNPNQSLWETIMALTRQLGGLQQTAAVISSTNTNVTPAPAPGPEPISPLSGCGQTLTPFGTTNQTIRCNGTNWVAAGNLLNDGVNVAIGPSALRGQTARLHVNDANSTQPYTAAILAENYGEGAVGVYSISNGDSSIGVYGHTLSENGVGVEGESQNASGTGVLGKSYEGGVAVKAKADFVSYGFFQEGTNAQNLFQGNLTLGGFITDATSTERLTIKGGIKFSSSGNIPFCNDAKRGTLWFNNGGLSGIDTMLVCAKTATSTYSWRNLF